MNGFASFAPAQGPMAGVPAGSQQPPLPQIEEAVDVRRPARKGGKGQYHLKNERRCKDDPYLGESEGASQMQNVERIFHWVHRGAATKKQRMVWWGMNRIDVDEAHEQMVNYHPGSCAHLSRGCCQPARPCREDLEKSPSTPFAVPVGELRPHPRYPESPPAQQYGIQHPLFPRPQASMPVHEGLSIAGHSTGNLQNTARRLQHPLPQYSETFGFFPQVPVGMPEHIKFFQGQGLGHHNPHLQALPVTMPVSQLPFGTGHSAEGLPAGPQQFETAFFAPGPLPQVHGPAEYLAPSEHGGSPPSLQEDLPEGQFSWDANTSALPSSLGTDSTVPDFSEGLQRWLDMPVVPQAEDKGFALSGMGTQFQDGASENLPTVASGIFDGIQEYMSDFSPYFNQFLE